MINKFSNVAKYKINLVKSMPSVYTTRKFIKEIKDILPFTEISKKQKHLRINLIKEMKYLFNGNFEPFKKEIKKILQKCMALWPINTKSRDLLHSLNKRSKNQTWHKFKIYVLSTFGINVEFLIKRNTGNWTKLF